MPPPICVFFPASTFQALYKCMLGEYRSDGIIVPPPPKLGSAALYTASTVAVASMTKDETLTTSVVTDRRCLALARSVS